MVTGLFDPITNSEDAMIARAGIKKYHTCTYLRAYIMASLCFEPQFIISDSSINLNKAFRTLIDYHESEGDYNLDYMPKADFGDLIREGHIRFAAREKFKGNFSEALRVSQQDMQAVDVPSERYTKMIDEICSNEYVYWYNLDEVSQLFTSKFKDSIREELNQDSPIPLKRVKLLRMLNDWSSDKETIKYRDVKSILLRGREEKDAEKDPEYQYIRRILRQSYDYNVPEVIHADYCMPLRGIQPSRNQDWVLKLDRELFLEPDECDLLCNIYGFSELPVNHLQYIWGSSEYENFRRQINRFRAGVIELDEYVISLKKYLLKINEVVRNVYTIKHNENIPYEKKKLSSIPIRIHHYFKSDDSWVVAAKFANDIRNIAGLRDNFLISIIQEAFFKALPVLAGKRGVIPDPPEEIREAIILQRE